MDKAVATGNLMVLQRQKNTSAPQRTGMCIVLHGPGFKAQLVCVMEAISSVWTNHIIYDRVTCPDGDGCRASCACCRIQGESRGGWKRDHDADDDYVIHFNNFSEIDNKSLL